MRTVDRRAVLAAISGFFVAGPALARRKPLRLSADDADPGYEAWCAVRSGNRIDVYLNGALVRDVGTADEGDGFLIRAPRDGNGDLMLTDDREAVKTERLNGLVRIEIVPWQR